MLGWRMMRQASFNGPAPAELFFWVAPSGLRFFEIAALK